MKAKSGRRMQNTPCVIKYSFSSIKYARAECYSCYRLLCFVYAAAQTYIHRLFIKHGRENSIAVKNYQLMEAGFNFINKTDAELLGALFKINPQYIEEHNFN